MDYDYDPDNMFTLDYIFQLLNGLRSDDYVEGTIACGILAAKTQRDVYALWYYFSRDNWLNRPDKETQTREHYEEAFFNATGEVTENFPTLLYKCYSVPFATSRYWSNRLNQFRDLEDFEQGFFQNLLGNTLSFNDISKKMQASVEAEDHAATVYQMGRLIRRLFDFQPMKKASGPAYTLQSANQSILDSLDISYD